MTNIHWTVPDALVTLNTGFGAAPSSLPEATQPGRLPGKTILDSSSGRRQDRSPVLGHPVDLVVSRETPA